MIPTRKTREDVLCERNPRISSSDTNYSEVHEKKLRDRLRAELKDELREELKDELKNEVQEEVLGTIIILLDQYFKDETDVDMTPCVEELKGHFKHKLKRHEGGHGQTCDRMCSEREGQNAKSRETRDEEGPMELKDLIQDGRLPGNETQGDSKSSEHTRDKKKPKLEAVTYGFDNSGSAVAEFTVIRDQFFEKISQPLKIKMNGDWRNGRNIVQFDRQEAVEITNFFFVEVLGNEAAQRLQMLIAEYNANEDFAGANHNLGLRARHLSRQIKFQPIAALFESLNRSARWELRKCTSLGRLLQSVDNVDLYKKCHSLLSLLIRGNPIGEYEPEEIDDAYLWNLMHDLDSYKSWLERTKSEDIGFMCLVYDSMEEIMGMEKPFLLEKCHQGETLHHLTKELGLGILLLLPDGAAEQYVDPCFSMGGELMKGRLRYWGLERMSAVYPILKEVWSRRGPMQDLYLCEKTLYFPIMQGQRLNLPAPVGTYPSIFHMLDAVDFYYERDSSRVENSDMVKRMNKLFDSIYLGFGMKNPSESDSDGVEGG